jgi:hypothetical protein
MMRVLDKRKALIVQRMRPGTAAGQKIHDQQGVERNMQRSAGNDEKGNEQESQTETSI